MTIHFFTKGDERLGDSRQRAFRIAEELTSRGIKTIVHRPNILELANASWLQKPALLLMLIRALRTVRKGDVLFLQRTVGNKYFFAVMVVYLWFSRSRMIFDFDDAVYLYDFWQTATFVRMADHVIVCSEPLAAWVRPRNPDVSIFHTSLRFADYAPFAHRLVGQTSPVVIGWVGTAKNHMQNLALLARVLPQVARSQPVPICFVLVGAGYFPPAHALFDALPDVPTKIIDSLDWGSPASVPRAIREFDIGVMPLVETDEWNLARSSFKPLEYMACRVATVASSVGEIQNVIRSGENGLLAGDESDWVEKVSTLVQDPILRNKLGAAGQEWVRDHESLEAIMPRLEALIRTVGERTIPA